ncbi:MAG TPA: serine/threonine-protein kinase [Kofleriaceae bacterium]
MSDVPELEIYAARRGELIGGNYVLSDVLGVGGMGVVYAAVQRSLDRVVALKVPRRELSNDPHVRRRLQVEALASSRISHRNSVHVFDYGDHAGAPYIVMEHVTGPRLGQLLAEHGPLPVSFAVRVVRQVTSVLEEAHANQIVHADIKCDNILIETRRDGSLVPRVIDWGIARFGHRHDQSDAAFVTGTPEYLAPEVVVGGRPTYAADVYAVGVMLYELIVGATPFAGQPALYKLEAGAVPLAMRQLQSKLPHGLDAIVERALATDPASRFADATMLGRALDAITLPSDDCEPIATRGASLPVFSTEAPTAAMPLADDVLATTCGAVARCRVALVAALQEQDPDAVVVAYLELARVLVDEHRLDDAIGELEHGIELLAEEPRSAPVWRLMLTLAALYDGIGDRDRARALAEQAHEQAGDVGSPLGCDRAERLAARLARSAWAHRER